MSDSTARRGAPVSTPRGTLQSERMPRALAPGWFDVDERRPEDWVALLAAQARYLRLPGVHGPRQGHWSALFEHHEVLLLASLTAGAVPPGEHGEAATPQALAHEVLHLGRVLAQWRQRLQGCDGEGARALLPLLRGRVQPRLEQGQARALEVAQAGDKAFEATDAQALAHELHGVRGLFVATLRQLGEAAREQLAQVAGSGRHDPAAALLATVVGLHGTVQRHLNGFTQRLIDCHVEQVLGMRPRPAVPDRVLLLAQRQPGAGPDPVLPAGSPLRAGRDAQGRDIVFRTRDELVVGDAQVAALYTLRLDRDRLISPEHELDYVCRAHSQQLPLGAVTDASLPVWPLFGGQELPSPRPAREAVFGLAVASRQLLLLEGERRIVLKLHLGHAGIGQGRLQPLVETLAAAARRGERRPLLFRTLVRLFKGYAAQETRRPRGILPKPGALARLAAPRLCQAPPQEHGAGLYLRTFLLLRAQLAEGDAFRWAAGQLFAYWLLSPRPSPARGANPDWLEPERPALERAARRALQGSFTPDSDDPLSLFLGEQRPDHALLLARLCRDLFSVSRTAPEGWREAPETHLRRPERPAPGAGLSLEVVVRLPASEPPLVGCDPQVHGAGWDTALPVLRLRLRGAGGVYPLSLLEPLQLLAVELAVSVRGLRQVALHNQLGPLDPGKPFQPFGPLPVQGSFLVIGSRELASKPLSALRLHLRWTGLPAGPTGFAGHYADWPGRRDNFSFRALPGVLHDGRWVAAPGAGAPLFAAPGPALALHTHHVLDFDPGLLQRHYQPLPGALPAQAPPFDTGATRALLRLQLSQPATAFGHAEYAALLSEAVAARARPRSKLRRKSDVAPLPAPPYTPMLEGLTLDYSSSTTLRLRNDPAEAVDGPRLYHLHPFGMECVFPRPQAEACRLLPRVAHDGNLFIGLRASAPPQRLTLLFRLDDASAVADTRPLPVPRWRALVGERWESVPPRQVLSDGTAGFQTSGIVVLELPAGIDDRHQVMPDGLYWLAVSVDDAFERFAGLLGVQAHAVVATRELAADEAAPAPLPPQAAFTLPTPVPGLQGLRPVSPATGLRAAETRQQLRVRTGEWLAHRRRALLPWDYERLVLERFPEVEQVKCFGAGLARTVQPLPAGQLVVAVVPGPHRYDRAGGILAPRLNAVELREIQALLQSLAPPYARVQVRNAAHEYIQVRCTLRLAQGTPEGLLLQRCERAVSDHLCPWVPGGMDGRFGWVVRAEDIEARLRAVAGVLSVTGVSLLHLSSDDDNFFLLGDSARGARPSAGRAVPRVEVRPAVPWGLAVPMARHMISVAREPAEREPARRDPVPTGITDLVVGRNFIIGSSHG